MSENNQQTPKAVNKITFLSFLGSLLAGWFGVSSAERHERDFAQGKFSHFIFGGIIFAVLFVFMVMGIVKLVMSTVGV